MVKPIKSREVNVSMKAVRVLHHKKNKPAAERKPTEYEKAADEANDKTVTALTEEPGKKAFPKHKSAHEAHVTAAKIAPTATLKRIHTEMAMHHQKNSKEPEVIPTGVMTVNGSPMAATGPGGLQVTKTTPAKKTAAKKTTPKKKVEKSKPDPLNPGGGYKDPDGQ